MAYRVVLEKENFKFSCSHFTILGPGRAERLHGHNYYVRVELGLSHVDPALGLAFDFNLVKPVVRDLLEEFDEMVLIPEKSDFLKIEKRNTSVAILFGKKKYELPNEDVKLLSLVNITSEELAKLISERLLSRLREIPQVISCLKTIEVGVEETRGQSVFYGMNI